MLYVQLAHTQDASDGDDDNAEGGKDSEEGDEGEDSDEEEAEVFVKWYGYPTINWEDLSSTKPFCIKEMWNMWINELDGKTFDQS